MALGFSRGYLSEVNERCRDAGEEPWIEFFIRFVGGKAVLSDLLNEVYWVGLFDMNNYAAALPYYTAKGRAFMVFVVHTRGQTEGMKLQMRTLRGDAPCIWYPDGLRVIWTSVIRPVLGNVSPNAYDRHVGNSTELTDFKMVI